jgi:hypothetical protein
MNAVPKLPRRHPVTSVLAAVLSVVIALALLGGVTESFQRDGAPFEQLVVAEHACTNYVYVSEREACVRVYLATARLTVLAHH